MSLNIEDLLIYRDALILAINKPAGIAVHKGSGRNNALDQYFDDLRFGLPRRPELVHRLDKDTSGVLLLGRNREGLRRAGELFQKGRVEKTYHAWVHGHLEAPEGIIDAPIAPLSERSHLWRGKVDVYGRQAITHYRTLAQQDNFTLLELKPQTGRSHQLRIHMSHLSHPIVGDPIYGADDGYSLMLHAKSLIMKLYPKKDPILMEAPYPDHFLLF